MLNSEIHWEIVWYIGLQKKKKSDQDISNKIKKKFVYY